MAITLTSLNDLARLGFDDIIDVRAPAEWAQDHLPGAINLAVLDDTERAEVGTIYKQISPFTARKVGGALVARNAARHLQGPLADKPGSWRPLVYCWRGGQRSGSFATILAQIGWRVETIAGGYKAWRGLVVDALYDRPFPCKVVVLDGNTGSAKTDILKLLPQHGLQVLDLEGLARHRGSLFGAMAGGQPTQRSFESALAMAMAALDPALPVVVEAESSKIGNSRLPPGLWKAMGAARRVTVQVPLAARAAYLARAYRDVTGDAERLSGLIDLLRPMHAAEVIDGWQAMAQAAAFEALAADLMQRHYDPRYAKHRARMEHSGSQVTVSGLDEHALPEVARQVAAAIRAVLA